MMRLVLEDIIKNQIINKENNKSIKENENIYPNKKIKKVVDKIELKWYNEIIKKRKRGNKNDILHYRQRR